MKAQVIQMKITGISIGKLIIPLKRPFKTALRQVTTAEDIVIKVHTDEGITGLGSAPATVVITGDSHKSAAEAIQNTILPAIIGMDIDHRETILQRIQMSMVHNTSAKAAVDIAVHDLFGKHYGLPLYRFFGGKSQCIPSDLTISINEPNEMAADARCAIDAGYHCLKLKVGIDATRDLARIRAVRQAVGPRVALRLDANQGWSAKEAVRTIRTLEDAGLDIELIEQPVSAYDLDGLKWVTDHVTTAIMADESAFSPHDVFRLVSMRACDLINIKLMKAGGLGPAAQIAALAAASGIECMMGCMLESKIGITAAASLSAGVSVITKNDLDAADLMTGDPISGGICYEKDTLILPNAPGLGITDVKGWQEIL
jgi:L-alanine-DL-glutamate epimerase-like enolase superfamily enzyme